MYYNILVARPFDQVFTYESDDQTLEVGQIVIVPFGKAMEVGMIMQADVSKPDYTIKKIQNNCCSSDHLLYIYFLLLRELCLLGRP